MSLDYAREVLDTEIAAIQAVRDRLDGDFLEALALCETAAGRIIPCGIGKAGLIARKVAATLASTGRTAFFLHPAEALHGDLGMVRAEDVLLIFSNSGESEEVVRLLPFVRRLGATVIAITGGARSTLAAEADKVILVGDIGEACPLGLAPTATTTAMLALGDALALCLMRRCGFQVEDYAKLHPAGALGRKTLPITSVMRTGEAVATARPEEPVAAVLLKITRARTGAAVVLTEAGAVAGIFCDGDLRRGLEEDEGILRRPVGEVMSDGCTAVSASLRVAEALELLNEKRLGEAPVVDEGGRFLGLADLKTLVKTVT